MSARSFTRARARRLRRERRRVQVLGRRGRLAGATIGASALLASSAQAATYTVNTNADDAPGGVCLSGGTCTLRDALSTANGDSTADTIVFAPSVTGTITLTNGALQVSNLNGITIEGPGASLLAVSGNHSSQIFTVTQGADAISGLTLENGSTGAPGGALEQTGGGPLTLSGDAITGSTTSSASPGGGGVYSKGTLTIANSTISGNTAPAGAGGGIAVSGASSSLSVQATTISGNSALSGGGVAGSTGGGRKYSPPRSAQITAGSQISGNHATGGSGGGIDGGFGVLSVNGSSLTGNTATAAGGGILSKSEFGTTVAASTISGNSAGDGGGIDVSGSGSKYAPDFAPVRISATTISGNQAAIDGAGVNLERVNPGNEVSISASTLSGNRGASGSFGGGLAVYGRVYGTVLLSDSTVSGNSAATGGGLSLGDASHTRLIGQSSSGSTGQILLDNATIAANSASGDGGGIYLGQYGSAPVQSGTASLRSTIVSGNSAHGSPQDLAGAAGSTSGGFNAAFSLIESPGSAPFASKQSVIAGVDPQLGALAGNGGPTQTMLPAGTSPVIDQGRAFDEISTDQRGQPRTVVTPIPKPPGGDGTDIGAVELPASSVVGIRFQVLIGGEALGGPKRPLIAGHHTPIRCAVRLTTISACTVRVAAGGKVVARGASVTTSPHGQIFLRVFLTQPGRKLLARHPLGLDAVAYAVGSAPGSPSVSGDVHLLAGPKFVLPGGDTGALSGHVKRQLDRIAGLLAGVSRVTCTAITRAGRGAARAEASAACRRLKRDGLAASYRAVGHGHSTGRSRLVISFAL